MRAVVCLGLLLSLAFSGCTQLTGTPSTTGPPIVLVVEAPALHLGETIRIAAVFHNTADQAFTWTGPCQVPVIDIWIADPDGQPIWTAPRQADCDNAGYPHELQKHEGPESPHADSTGLWKQYIGNERTACHETEHGCTFDVSAVTTWNGIDDLEMVVAPGSYRILASFPGTDHSWEASASTPLEILPARDLPRIRFQPATVSVPADGTTNFRVAFTNTQDTAFRWTSGSGCASFDAALVVDGVRQSIMPKDNPVCTAAVTPMAVEPNQSISESFTLNASGLAPGTYVVEAQLSGSDASWDTSSQTNATVSG